jgi:hypothetical protein
MYLCKWREQGDSLTRLVGTSFFNNSNGYTKSDISSIKKMKIGDTLDLSDGISQYHEIERVA